MSQKTVNIVTAVLGGALLIAILVSPLGYFMRSTDPISSPPDSASAGNAPREVAAGDSTHKAPPFRVPLIVVPGDPTFDVSTPTIPLVSGGPVKIEGRGPEAVDITSTGQGSSREAQIPKTPINIELRPSLKYAYQLDTVSAPKAYPIVAGNVPLISVESDGGGGGGANPAPPVAPKPATIDIEAERRALINANLKMEDDRRFVRSMCVDHQGRLWVASESLGPTETEGSVQCFDPSAPELHQWTQFTTNDGLGSDTATAVACDQQGRIWVGHSANHGVSVFNGQKWQNYSNAGIPTGSSGLLGPLGERVSHITICPTDGDVWIATDCGLARYSDSKGTWTIYGLTAGEATSLAFDTQGNIYVATMNDGIAMANAAENYSTWRSAIAPDPSPMTQSGSGLASNSINDILVAEDGTLYAATDDGLAMSKDDGGSWQFIRGRDWAENIRRQGGTPPLGAGQVQTGSVALPPVMLAEDYCSCLMESRNADTATEQIYIGHRQSGVDLFDPANGRIADAAPRMYARTFANTGHICVGTYGPRHHFDYPGPGGVDALVAATNGAAAPRAASSLGLTGLPAGALPVGPTPLEPELEIGHLRDLYAAGRFNELLHRCARNRTADIPRGSQVSCTSSGLRKGKWEAPTKASVWRRRF